MTPQEKLNELAAGLNGAVTENELTLNAEIMEGDVEVLVVTITDREEFPVYLTVDESQILCISHLWTESEVEQNKRMDLLDAMLTMNVPMPLSSFSKTGNQYLIFGALSNRSPANDVIEEIDVLSDNTLTAIEELSEFLVKQN
ncbi:MAG: YjfI family protein [Gammaproteobacteria bacterium]|nr:YjfI family protein [Gammaproteobacteria bacterium]